MRAPVGRASVPLLGLSVLTTAVGVAIAYRIELAFIHAPLPWEQLLTVGFIEEALVRFVPLIVTFYAWSYRRGYLLSKTEGLLATLVSAATVAGLELALKLRYLSGLETAARFDALVLPVLFVHLPFALIAGRLVYALGQRIHGTQAVGLPSLSRQTIMLLVLGYLLLVGAHVTYNVLV